ncbi:hypothetical protein IWQ61_007063 [Dispira simplex]|nr:hypothetical protein IWQ61_007063 [Dispira simplex]
MSETQTRAPLVAFQPGELQTHQLPVSSVSQERFSGNYPPHWSNSTRYSVPTSGGGGALVTPSPWRPIRVPRDYSQGELRQFTLDYPVQLEGKLSALEFQRYIEKLNALLHDAEAPLFRHAVDNILSYFTLDLYTMLVPTYYDRAMRRVYRYIADENTRLFEPCGLKVTNPNETAFLYLEIKFLNVTPG